MKESIETFRLFIDKLKANPKDPGTCTAALMWVAMRGTDFCDDVEKLLAEKSREEEACEQLIGERDFYVEEIGRIASELRLSEQDSEWSNLNHVPDRCAEKAFFLINENETYRGKLKEVDDLRKRCSMLEEFKVNGERRINNQRNEISALNKLIDKQNTLNSENSKLKQKIARLKREKRVLVVHPDGRRAKMERAKGYRQDFASVHHIGAGDSICGRAFDQVIFVGEHPLDDERYEEWIVSIIRTHMSSGTSSVIRLGADRVPNFIYEDHEKLIKQNANLKEQLQAAYDYRKSAELTHEWNEQARHDVTELKKVRDKYLAENQNLRARVSELRTSNTARKKYANEMREHVWWLAKAVQEARPHYPGLSLSDELAEAMKEAVFVQNHYGVPEGMEEFPDVHLEVERWGFRNGRYEF